MEINKKFLDKLYGLRHAVNEKLKEESSVSTFKAGSCHSEVNRAECKQLEFHLSSIDAIIEAYISSEAKQ